MAPIVVESAVLHQTRRATVRRLVAPLLPVPPNVEVQQVGVNRDAYVLGVVPRGRIPSSYLNPEEALVPTRVPRILMNYYESWRSSIEPDEYFLDRAYMHIHVVVQSTQQHVLSLHCDPALRSSDSNFRYKRGPHVHVEGAIPTVNRAHISLCLMDERLGGDTILALTSSLREAVKMISAELFPCWERASVS
jgi:hypothetical protein